MRGRVWTLLVYAVWLTWNEAEGSTAIAPVFSLPATTKLNYPTDNNAQLLSTPIQIQAEATGGFAVLGKFFFASIDVNPWDKLFQLRNFNLETADEVYLQIMFYQSDTAENYRFQIWKDGSSCSGDFAKPATDNAWISVNLQYDTGTDTWKLMLNDLLVAQTTCSAGWLENFELNRVIVASQNWAGLRLYDSLLTDAEVASELQKICVDVDTCADVLTAGCDSAPACPLTCSDNTYASSGAVLAFNPSAAGETFDRSIPTEVDMGPVQWNVIDNGGVTLVSKLKFSASPSNYERVFAATESATAGNALFQIMRRAETEAMFFIINDGDTSCLSDDIPITNEQWFSMLFQYEAATANMVVQLDGGTKHYKDCSAVAGFSAQNRLQNVNIFGKHGGSSPHFHGAIGGFYGFNSLLTSAQVSLVLDSIVVGGDDTSAPLECAPCPTDGTVVAGCSGAAAAPQNITFLVSAGNVSATTLAPHHPAILSAVATSLGTAASQMSIASIADTAHNAAILRLVAADVPGADVDTLSQKTNEVAAAVKDAVNTAAGGSAVVCAAKAATILGSGANLTVYC